MKNKDAILNQDTIDNLFAKHADNYHQANVLIELYKLVMPEWDNIRKIHDWPRCNEFTWKYIASKFIEFDKYYHPDCLAGGCWMNNGFSIEKNIGNWIVEPANNVQYKGDKNPIERVYISYSWTDTNNNRQVRIQVKRKFTCSSYTVKHFASFAKMLYRLNCKFERLESNSKVCYFTKG